VTSRKKEVERLQTADLQRSNIARPFIRFQMGRPSGRHPLEVKGLSKSYDGPMIIRDFTASISRGEKIGILGRNGVGKTTLLRSIIANAPGAADKSFAINSGQIEWGHEAAVGYFAEDHKATIQPGMTILEWLHQYDPQVATEDIRGLLGQMLFARDESMKPTAALSGGEAARLIFCRLMLQKPNILVLDEPTNHLDLESINALNIALQKFEGTIFLVTHDHDLLDEVATRIWRLDGSGVVEDIKSTYEELLAVTA
jgi:ATPase subunit of ABC transporter with duplicated ATPase domains